MVSMKGAGLTPRFFIAAKGEKIFAAAHIESR
jgi:hypothetical protein